MVLALNYRAMATVISKPLLTVYDLKKGGQGLYHESSPCGRVISKTARNQLFLRLSAWRDPEPFSRLDLKILTSPSRRAYLGVGQ